MNCFDRLEKLFKPCGLKCPKCGSKNLVEYTNDSYLDLDEDGETSFLFECEDCGHCF